MLWYPAVGRIRVSGRASATTVDASQALAPYPPILTNPQCRKKKKTQWLHQLHDSNYCSTQLKIYSLVSMVTGELCTL